ncbi:MAG TPA: hypothetical protein VKE40_03720 [Gemmataceae bacterium]|nr:hypothetical protein [Gemmataceae bacterium]
MSPEVGSRVIGIARGLIGSHYINGGYGACPDREDGCPCRIGSVKLIADANRLNPGKLPIPNQNLAVFAAEMSFVKEDGTKVYCVCAGNYATAGGKETVPNDGDLVSYLQSLKGKPPAEWSNFSRLTPRRAFGPGPGGDLGGKLVWGLSCKAVRHFDCVGFISYCYWKATGKVMQLAISGWRTPNLAGTVYDLGPGGKRPPSLMDGDIIVQADHHIGYVDSHGAIIEAQDTHLGVRSTGHFTLAAPGKWTHLVRLAAATDVPALEWPMGWWKVWDGNTYFYYLGPNGVAQYTKTSPLDTRVPPKNPKNVGRYTFTPPSQLVITWNKIAGASDSCRETFYNAVPECWKMNAYSNLYGPLGATRMA